MWNVYSLDGPRTNIHAEGWHSKVMKLDGKAHPNIYEVVSFFKSEQAATEVTFNAGSSWGTASEEEEKV